MYTAQSTSDTGRWVTIVRLPGVIVQTAFKAEDDARDLAGHSEDMIGVVSVEVDFVRNFAKRPRVTVVRL
jgi:hypothetical protein